MQLPQIVLALCCVLLGLAPGVAFGILQRAIAATPQGAGALLAQAAPVSAGVLSGVTGPLGTAVFVPAGLLAALGVGFLVAYGISRMGSAPRRAAAPWLCGYATEAECDRYIAHNFYSEVKRHFHWVGGAENGKVAVVKGRTS